MKYGIFIFVIIGLLIMGAQARKSEQTGRNAKRKERKVSYKKEIVPIFKKYCLPCHTEDEMNPSQLYLESYSDLMNGGKHGTVVVPGQADSSNLIRKISATPPFGDPMPFRFKRQFPADTLAILERWINQGAKNN